MIAQRLVPSLLARTATLTAVWWAIVEGDTSVLRYGLVLVPAAVALSLALSPPGSPRPSRGPRAIATLRLAGWFLWFSLLGGVDVARRAVSTPLDLDPDVIEHAWRTSDRRVRILVAAFTSLMPGSLSIHQHEDVLELHVLDDPEGSAARIDRLEQRVCAALGATLD